MRASKDLNKLKQMSAKALVIAAHPDDESLFAGGIMAEFKKWRWAILCVTDCDKRRNMRRREELTRASSIYKQNGNRVKPVMLGVVKNKGRYPKEEIRRKIYDFIKKSGPFQAIFTHNKDGDYGHKAHALIHDIVKGMRLRNTYSFSRPFSKNAQEVILSPGSRRTKRRALNVYLKGSQKTNLSRLKKIVTRAIRSDAECFQRVN